MARWYNNSPQNFTGYRPNWGYNSGRSNYGRGGYRSNWAYNSGHGQRRKTSGINRSGQSKKGNAFISAWKVERKAGLIGIFATQTKNCKTVTLKNGKQYNTMRVEITQGFSNSVTFGYWNDQGRYLLIPQFGLQVNVSKGFVSRMNKR